MARLIILIICGFIPGIISQCNVQRSQLYLKRSAYEFAVELTTRIAQEKENHFVASTLSAWTLLSTSALGAAGGTLEEFQKVLRLHKQQCFNDRNFELIRSITGDGTNVTIERSSTVFAAEGLAILDTFRKRIRDAGVSSFEFLAFDDPDFVVASITDFVSRATHNTITDLVVPSDLDGIYLIMVDAIFFKGLWQTPFPYENTEIKPFFDDAGVEVGEVNLMTVTGTFNMSTISLIDATVLELPFGSDGRFVMLIFLPRSNTTLSAVIDSLLKVSLSTIYTIFAQNYMQSVSVQIPKFKISSDLDNLKELLVDMGLKKAFSSDAAEFPYLSYEALFISNIVQKANIEVSEAGSTATAATAGLFSSRSGPDEFRADKPFLYMIVDTVTQVPLFTGAYSKPSL